MQFFTLRRYTDNTSLFSGYYTSFISCLEHAVKQQQNLSYIDLKNKNLSNANLDMAMMPYAKFENANLTGCNLSECDLSDAKFYNTSLYNTCLAHSKLRRCDFRGASFGATLIEYADMRDCVFSTLSCFDLDFNAAKSIEGAKYMSCEQTEHTMSQTPIVLKGLLNTPVIILDDTTKIGSTHFSSNIVRPLMNHLHRNILQTSTVNDINSQTAKTRRLN